MLLTHRDDYQSPAGILSSLSVTPAPHPRLVYEAVTLGEYGELAHTYAASAALGIATQSYMPAITAGYDHYTCRVQEAGKLSRIFVLTD